jgi:hypothetical protein
MNGRLFAQWKHAMPSSFDKQRGLIHSRRFRAIQKLSSIILNVERIWKCFHMIFYRDLPNAAFHVMPFNPDKNGALVSVEERKCLPNYKSP